MHIHGRWHQLLGSHAGTQLSHQADCNTFGLATSAGLILFDAGSGIDLPRGAFEAAGFPQGPSHILLTHGHADHSGGAAGLAATYGATLHAGELTALWLDEGNEDRISLPAARRAGVYPPDYRFAAVRVDQLVRSGAPIAIGEAMITPVATPGHSADHLSYLVEADGETVLVGGDAIFAGGTVVLQDTWDSSVAQTCESIRMLSALSFDVLLAGHGPCVLTQARSVIDIAMARVARLLPPLNFL